MPTPKLKPDSARLHLQAFAFGDLFIQDIGWNHPASESAQAYTVKETTFTAKPIADLSGFRVFEVTASNGAIPDAATQDALWKQVTRHSAENLLIFLDTSRHTSLWLWMRREPGVGKNKAPKIRPRRHPYVKGQPGDLFLSKIAAMAVDLSELDEEGNIPITDAANRVRKALDIETVTKAFFNEFADEHGRFLQDIQGIPKDDDRRWYASVILNRLMFIWFLQKKFFLDGRDESYLPNLLAKSQKVGKNRFFAEVLRDLFFEGFAKPAPKRHRVGSVDLGDIPYLNGGLFLPHGIEARIEGEALFTGPFQKIKIKDDAFAGVFDLFGRYSWNLNDVPGADDREINPDVLGYIFEKYINQKEFGAYYTRPEITEYLCEQTVHQLVLDAANQFAIEHANFLNKVQKKGVTAQTYETISDVLLHADGPLCRHLLKNVLPRLSLLDPACGSGAFLVAAMKTLLSLITGLLGRAEAIQEREILDWVQAEQKKHKAPLAYWIKKKIITENIYGVDIMEEAVEIAKLRLFLALVASAETRDQLEPLPNIEFNLLSGNSLIGLLHVDPAKYDDQTGNKGSSNEQERITLTHKLGGPDLSLEVETKTAPTRKEKVGAFLATKRASQYEELLREKNRLIQQYKETGGWASSGEKQGEIKALTDLRQTIEETNRQARAILNKLLLDEFQGLDIQFEQATWDNAKGKEGKPEKRKLRLSDIETLQPFHWAYEFDEIIVNRGGFDAIITNPPWEVFKPNSKEFFQKFSDVVTKKKMRIEDFEDAKDDLLADDDIRAAWLDYLSTFPYLSGWFRSAPQFQNQIGKVNGKKVGSDLNLYKIFLEQTSHLLRRDGRCGIVIPSGIYTDLGAMQLRLMLLDQNRVTSLFGLSNEKFLFESVHHAQKFTILTYVRGENTDRFQAAFRINPREAVRPGELYSLFHEPDSQIPLSVDLIKRLSPGSFSVMEFKNLIDIQIAEKMFLYPSLGEEIPGSWNVKLAREFDMTQEGGTKLVYKNKSPDREALCEGRQIWHFDHQYAEPRYWIEPQKLLKFLSGSKAKYHPSNDFRLAFRRQSASTNERTLVTTIIPPCFHADNLASLLPQVEDKKLITLPEQVFLTAVLNSLVVDYAIRQRVTNNLNFFYIYQLPVPRLTEKASAFRPLVERAARLIGTTAEFDELLAEVFGSKATHKTHGVTDLHNRQTLRAEIDALVAQLYDLTEEEFTHILSTFPLVDESIKQQTLNTFRDLNRLGKLPDSRI